MARSARPTRLAVWAVGIETIPARAISGAHGRRSAPLPRFYHSVRILSRYVRARKLCLTRQLLALALPTEITALLARHEEIRATRQLVAGQRQIDA